MAAYCTAALAMMIRPDSTIALQLLQLVSSQFNLAGFAFISVIVHIHRPPPGSSPASPRSPEGVRHEYQRKIFLLSIVSDLLSSRTGFSCQLLPARPPRRSGRSAGSSHDRSLPPLTTQIRRGIVSEGHHGSIGRGVIVILALHNLPTEKPSRFKTGI